MKIENNDDDLPFSLLRTGEVFLLYSTLFSLWVGSQFRRCMWEGKKTGKKENKQRGAKTKQNTAACPQRSAWLKGKSNFVLCHICVIGSLKDFFYIFSVWFINVLTSTHLCPPLFTCFTFSLFLLSLSLLYHAHLPRLWLLLLSLPLPSSLPSQLPLLLLFFKKPVPLSLSSLSACGIEFDAFFF
ncbi:uncharacterized protein TEOVI_000608200 [Trypanosoma equiperdum]|uniref:Transmembrane protein n=1 Tax=Trypanosoma equiperdum TaxID=5694 RepID=A0A1G4I9Z0_TRYEQ|nr:hypothetical protein, conserved [Trypanosoma equiperdum]